MVDVRIARHVCEVNPIPTVLLHLPTRRRQKPLRHGCRPSLACVRPCPTTIRHRAPVRASNVPSERKPHHAPSPTGRPPLRSNRSSQRVREPTSAPPRFWRAYCKGCDMTSRTFSPADSRPTRRTQRPRLQSSHFATKRRNIRSRLQQSPIYPLGLIAQRDFARAAQSEIRRLQVQP